MVCIVKLKKSNFPRDKKILAYDKNRTFFHEQDMTPDLEAIFGGRRKVYCLAHVGRKTISLLTKVKQQDW